MKRSAFQRKNYSIYQTFTVIYILKFVASFLLFLLSLLLDFVVLPQYALYLLEHLSI